MIYKTNQKYIGAKGRESLYDFYADETEQEQPLIVFCHGYKGFKDWGAWNEMARFFVENGFAFLKFNFSHNGGTAEEPIDFPDLEAFSENRYSYEVKDLELILDLICEGKEDFFNQIDREKIYLIGHSRGGGIAILKAANDERVKKLVTWAAVSDFKARFSTGKNFEEWRSSGMMTVKNGRTKQDMPHRFSFYEDFMENEDELTILKAAQLIDFPYLIIHGLNDEAVKPNEAKVLHQNAKESELILIRETGHTFDTRHPHSGELPRAFREVLSKTLTFFES